MLTVVGTPLSETARAALEDAALVVGEARHLERLPVPAGSRKAADADDLLTALDDFGGIEQNVVVVTEGDPGFFGIVRELRERGHAVRILPGLSLVARAFARSGLPWDDALVVSARGEDLRRAVNACRAHPKVAVLTAPGAGPAELARALFPQTPRSFVVCEDLDGPDERVVHVRPAEATTRPWHDPEVVLVLDSGRAVGKPSWIAGAAQGPAEWVLPQTAYAGNARGPVTPELRAFVLAKLGPRVGDMVWVIGAGEGAPAIECARFGAAVVAVERDIASCERIRGDVRAHGVKVAVSRGEVPDVLPHLPDPDAVFVAGGGAEAVRACAARALRRVVAVPADPSTEVGAMCAALDSEGLTAEAVRLQVTPLVPPLEPAEPLVVVFGARGDQNPARRPPEPARRPQTIAELPEGRRRVKAPGSRRAERGD